MFVLFFSICSYTLMLSSISFSYCFPITQTLTLYFSQPSHFHSQSTRTHSGHFSFLSVTLQNCFSLSLHSLVSFLSLRNEILYFFLSLVFFVLAQAFRSLFIFVLHFVFVFSCIICFTFFSYFYIFTKECCFALFELFSHHPTTSNSSFLFLFHSK